MRQKHAQRKNLQGRGYRARSQTLQQECGANHWQSCLLMLTAISTTIDRRVPGGKSWFKLQSPFSQPNCGLDTEHTCMRSIHGRWLRYCCMFCCCSMAAV